MFGQCGYIVPDAVGSPGPMQHDMLKRHTTLKGPSGTRYEINGRLEKRPIVEVQKFF